MIVLASGHNDIGEIAIFILVFFVLICIGAWCLNRKESKIERQKLYEKNLKQDLEQDRLERLALLEQEKKYREEYDEYIMKSRNMDVPRHIRPFTFDEWREFHKKY